MNWSALVNGNFRVSHLRISDISTVLSITLSSFVGTVDQFYLLRLFLAFGAATLDHGHDKDHEEQHCQSYEGNKPPSGFTEISSFGSIFHLAVILNMLTVPFARCTV